MSRLFKETLHADGPPKISLRDKIQEEHWGKKITTLDYPRGIEINKSGFFVQPEFKDVNQGLQYLIEREKSIFQDDQFQKSVAKKYNACALLKLNEEQKIVDYHKKHILQNKMQDEEEEEEKEEEDEDEDVTDKEEEEEEEDSDAIEEPMDEGDEEEEIQDDLDLNEIEDRDFSI